MNEMKNYLLIILINLLTFLYAGCNKEDHLDHDMPHNEMGVPYLPSSLYVANEEDGTISVIDPVENKKIGDIHLSENMSSMLMPHNVQVAPDGKSIWVTTIPETEGEMEQVIVINPTSNHSIIKRINIGTKQHLAHVVFDSLSTYAFVTANETNQVIQIDAKTFTEVKRFNLDSASRPHGLRYSRDHLYVANMNAKSLSVITISNNQINQIPLSGMAVQTAVTPDGKYVFVSLYDTKEIARYDIQNQQVSKILLPPNSQGPIQIYPTPDSKFLYVCDQGVVGGNAASNKVYVIDIANSTVINTITVDYAAHGAIISNDGKMAYITNSLSNTISVIDISTQQVIHTIAVGKAPNGISYRFLGGGMP